jgi:hypothetical protein
MDRTQILNIIKKLAQSQGFYSILYKHFKMLKECYPEQYEKTLNVLESEQFENEIDLILYLEM